MRIVPPWPCLALAFIALLIPSSFCRSVYAQAISATGSIAGSVVDPQGAVMPQALITLTRVGGAPMTVMVDPLGRFSATSLAPGTYSVDAEAPGFRPQHKEGIILKSGIALRLAFTLEIEVQQQQVVVSDADLDSSPEKNGGAIVLKGKEIDTLSDDPSQMQMQLEAIAGSDPESGTQFFIDGFSGGKLPPKNSIREIRINQNPYSAQYDSLGFGRIEIFTKPGTDKLHGDVWMQGNDSPWNARNPFVKTQPPYHSYFVEGDLNGPLSKTASYFVNVFGQNSVNNSIVNAVVLDNALQPASFTQAIASPSTTLNLSPRLDYQLGKTQTLTLRYQLQRNTQTNAGVGQFALASQAFNTENTEQVLQFSDTQAYGVKVVNETRFQYIRDRNNQIAADPSPTIAVQGAFTGGGSSQGVVRDNQDHYEFQDYLQATEGKHDLNIGVRLRALRDSNYSTANFNGQYTFDSLTAYQITAQGLQNGLSPAAIRAAGGGASQFIQTRGAPGIAVSVLDAGVYAEDNWKVTPNVTLSYGLRFESQTRMHDHADLGPRVGASWAIPGGKNKPPRAVIRAGYGWFYQRFASGNVLQAERQNGITQSEIIVNAPDFYPTGCSASPTACAASSASAATVYRVSPALRAPYTMMGGIGVDMPLGKVASISANYMHSRGEHLYLTRNINAPLPGTYDPTDPSSGTRPLGVDQNIYEYESEGDSSRNRLVINGDLHAKNLGLFGYYMLSKADANTSGAETFPSNSYDLHQDYGRASYDVRQRLFFGGFAELPGKISINPFLIYQSGSPFNLTVGQDLNGDTQFNDRPAFATDLTRPSVYRTRFGNFDASPIAGQRLVPINYGSGPGFINLNVRLSKVFNFGPIVPDEAPTPAPDAKDTKADAKAAPKAAEKEPAKTPAKPVKKPIERKYTLGLGINSNNIFNHVNLAAPVGVLRSPLFGTSTSLNNIFGNGSANRTVNLDFFFRF